MELSLFDFNLPRELIAVRPSNPRDNSTLLTFDSQENILLNKFYQILDYLNPGDVLCFNDSKVVKSKLIIKNESGEIEVYLNTPIKGNIWHGFARPSKKLKEDDVFYIGNNKLTILKKLEWGQIEIKLETEDSIELFLNKFGLMPLPPYMKRNADDRDTSDYQTIYSKIIGSVASPTAGLHFTEDLLKKIVQKNVEIAFITLHIGAGTFLPIKCDNIYEHKMHAENFYINDHTASQINTAKKENRRVICVGTTSLRALESAYSNGMIVPGSYVTDIFITPKFKLNVVDTLITNLHLPKSTLLILVSTFAGYHKTMRAYEYAIANKLRFFSYGDVMMLNRLEY